MQRLFARLEFFLLLSAALMLCGCGERPAFELTGATQGTTYHITVVASRGAAQREQLNTLVEKRLAAIDAALSNYADNSELSRFNRTPVDVWVPVGHDLLHVLVSSQNVSAQSGGAFDVTIAPLVDLWGFGAGGRSNELPDDAAVEAARAQVDYRQLEIDSANNRARKKRALRIDVNGIAQGYTVDCLADLLAAQGYTNFLVEVGGELRLVGLNAAGDAWRIGIEQPADGIGAVQQAIAGSGIGITTAGDYHDYFERDGKRYSHTIDPITGRPITHRLASVTVIASSAEYADGMDTALEVLGPERGLQLAEQLKIAAYFIIRTDRGFNVRYTTEFKRYLYTGGE